MSYALVVAEIRRGVFEERNLDAIGLARVLKKDVTLVKCREGGAFDETLVEGIVTVDAAESAYLNPMNVVALLDRLFAAKGAPAVIIFTHSSFGMEAAGYVAGSFGFPLVTDVAACEGEEGFQKSYYSDKVFGTFKGAAGKTCVVTVRSGSFKAEAQGRGGKPEVTDLDAPPFSDARSFVEYVEEEKTEIDITKADFLVSVGRGIGSKDEVPAYDELAKRLNGVLSCSRPVVDKLWMPKPRQVGTSGKTVKPKVYMALGISGAFQHIAGMKDAECIIAINKDAEAPIFQYAHYGIVGDAQKVRDKLLEIVKG